MKKGLIVLLVLILVAGAFFAGSKVNINVSVEPTMKITNEENAESSTFEDIYYEEPDTSSYEYQPEGFDKIGKNFDTILAIHDFHIDDVQGESYFTTLTHYGRQGYYLEYPYASTVRIYATKSEERERTEAIEIYTDDLERFEFIDDNRLSIGIDGDPEGIFDLEIEEIIESNEYCTIFKSSKNMYGYDNDQIGVYFVALKYENIEMFESVGIGKKMYNGNPGESIFVGFEERQFYF